MTEHKAPLTINGVALAQQLLKDRARLAQRIGRELAQEIPAYQELSAAEFRHINRTTETNLRMFAQSLRRRAVPTLAEWEPITASAARRAGEGFPLDAVMAAYSSGMTTVWRTMTTSARPADLSDVLACTELVLGYMQRASEAVAAAYLRQRSRLDSDDQQRRYTLLHALLRGEPYEEPAARARLQVPERYVVLALHFGQHDDERESGAQAVAAGRRKVYRATEVLSDLAGSGVLVMLDSGGGTALVPEQASDPDEMTARISAASGVEVRAASVVAAPGAVGAAARQAGEIVDLVVTLGKGAGCYQLSDVLLEYQLTRPSVARNQLGRALDLVRERVDLFSTLCAYVRLGLDRRRTATELHVHVNTVDYRVRRCRELTGLDPHDPADLQRIGAGIVIGRLSG